MSARFTGKLRKAIQNPSLVRNRLKRVISDRGLDARFGRGRALLPSTLLLAPTFRCNLDCLTCGVGHNVFSTVRMPSGADFRHEMTWEEWVPVLDQIGSFRPAVLVSGGEPLESPIWGRLVTRLARRHGVFVSLATNGIGLDEILDEAMRAGVRHIHLSIDGWGEDFDAVRGNGSFERLLRSLEALARARRDQAALGISVICAVTPFNVGNLASIFRNLIDFQISDLLVQHLVRFTEEERDDANRRLTDPRQRALWTWGERLDPAAVDLGILREQVHELKRIAREAPAVGLRFVPDLETHGYERFYSPGPMEPVSGFRCSLFWKATYIFPDGSVMPSQICHYQPVGNVRDRPFREIWNGPDYRRIRRAVWREGWLAVCGHCYQPYGGCI